MLTEAPGDTIHTMHIVKEDIIAAPIGITFESALAELGPEGQMHDGSDMKFKIEAWPGGRWYRDLGNGAGHLWGHVQVIKPPTLIELTGPLCMSYPCANFVQYRFTEEGPDATRFKLMHRAFGMLAEEHRDGMPEGWGHMFERVREIAGARLRAKQKTGGTA